MKILDRIKRLQLNWKLTLVTLLTFVITIALLAGVLFYEQEQNVVNENKNYMRHKQERYISQIDYCTSSINMSTQFFLADEGTLAVLKKAQAGETLGTLELIKFQNDEIKNLERIVSNNPILYSVRYYAANNNVQEIMPILYNSDRMKNLAWASEEAVRGWHFDYADTAFSSLITNQKNTLAGYVTEVVDYREGTIGYIEAALYMNELFPGMYEDRGTEFGCFITESGDVYYGDNKWDDSEIIIDGIRDKIINSDFSDEIQYIKNHKKNLIISTFYSKKLGGYVIGVQNITAEVNNVYRTRNVFVAIMILIIVGMAFTVNRIIKKVLRQLYVIIDNMTMVREGNLNARIEEVSYDEVGKLGESLNLMLDRIQALMQENIDREVLAKNSEIRALQNQINAHFIYNVLESIKMMAEIDEKYEISDAITSLGKLLRYSMRWVSGNVKVYEELEYIKDYMALINLRYDYPIHLGVNIPEELMELEIPKMSLQPVVENAILHGIEPMGEESTIYIKGWVEDGDCIIEVSDTGRGMTDDELSKLQAKIEGKVEVSGGKGHGIGVKNVHDRIIMAFGPGYGISIYTKMDCYTKVGIRIPVGGNREKKA